MSLPRLLTRIAPLSLAFVAACGPPPAPLPRTGEHAPSSAPPAAQAQPNASVAGHPAGASPHASGPHSARHGHAHGGHATGAEHAHRDHSPGGGHGHAHSAPTSDHRFEDAEHWAKVFDDPARDEWQRPDDVVRELGLGPSDVVADIGAGTGYFITRLSRAVPKGKVLGVDIEATLVDHMKKRAAKEGVKNFEAILAAKDDPKLPKGVNVILVVDTYHHIGDRAAYFQRVRSRLANGGRVVIVDFKKGKLPVGPPDDHKLAPDVVQTEMKAAGYQQCRSFDQLPYQYYLVFAEKC